MLTQMDKHSGKQKSDPGTVLHTVHCLTWVTWLWPTSLSLLTAYLAHKATPWHPATSFLPPDLCIPVPPTCMAFPRVHGQLPGSPSYFWCPLKEVCAMLAEAKCYGEGCFPWSCTLGDDGEASPFSECKERESFEGWARGGMEQGWSLGVSWRAACSFHLRLWAGELEHAIRESQCMAGAC